MQQTRKRALNTKPTGEGLFRSSGKKTLSEVEYEKLRARIVSMDLLPGTALSEPELAAQSGVSRTPVREAILRLSRENLVEVAPKSGTYVARIPVSVLPEALIARRSLEATIARAAAKFAKRSQIMESRAILERQKELAAKGEMENFHLSDEAFHQHLTVMARLPGLWDMVQDIKLQVDRFRRLTLPEPGRMTMAIGEHEAIVNAIEAGNPEAAEAATEAHLTGLQIHIANIVNAHPDYFIHDADLDDLVSL
jgi:DNA-binding GntR family transcriptional regulator